MSPRHKSHHTPTTSSSSSSTAPHEPVAPTKEGSKPRKTSTTTTTTTSTTAAAVVSHRSSIPSLPDVHGKAPSAGLQAGNFLLTLLAEERLEEENEEEGVGRVQENGEGRSNDEGSRNSGGSSSSRSVLGTKTKGKVTQEGQGHHLNILERSDKHLPGGTLTARSDKILTASWAGFGDAADDGRRGQRRRHSRDSGGLSTRRLSGPVPSKRKFRHKPSLSNSPRPQAEFQTGLPSPRAPGQDDSTKAVEVLQTSGNPSISPAEEEVSGDPVRPGFGSAYSPSDSEKCVSGVVESTDVAAVSKKQSDPVQVNPGLEESSWASKPTPSSPRTTHSLQTEKARYTGKTSSASAADVAEARTTVSQITPGSGQATNTAMTSSLPLTSSTQPSDPFNQWTTCRALDDTDDDENDDAYDENVDTLGYSKTSEDMQNVVADSSMVDGRFSRAASSNPTRRKRPLLLPPIMLPPVYTVKPTPLILRDDVYFASTGSRARRPISDEEWDKLWDCRYLRIRTLRRPLKV